MPQNFLRLFFTNKYEIFPNCIIHNQKWIPSDNGDCAKFEVTRTFIWFDWFLSTIALIIIGSGISKRQERYLKHAGILLILSAVSGLICVSCFAGITWFHQSGNEKYGYSFSLVCTGLIFNFFCGIVSIWLSRERGGEPFAKSYSVFTNDGEERSSYTSI